MVAGFVWGALALLVSANTALSRIGWIVRALAFPAMVAILLLALWSLIRWPALRVPIEPGSAETVWLRAPGRSSVVGYQWMAVSAVLGASLGCLRRPESVNAWRAVRWGFAGVAVWFSADGLYQYFVGYERELARLQASLQGEMRLDPLMAQSLEHALRQRRIGGSLGNANIFAAWLSVLSVFCLALLHRRNRSFERFAGLAIWMLLAVTVLLTGSRGGLLTFAFAAVGGIGVLALQQGLPGLLRGKPTDVAGLALLGGALLAALPRIAQAQSVWSRLTEVSTIRERVNYWQIALEIWAGNWWGGGGPGAFESFYAQFKPGDAREARYAHSWVFQTLADLGVVGLAVYLAFWGFLFWSVLRLYLAFFQGRIIAAHNPAATARSAGGEEAPPLPAAEPDPVEEAAAGRRLKHPRLPPGRRRAEEALWLIFAAIVLGFNGLFEYSLQMAEFRLLLGFLAGGGIGLTCAALYAGSPRRLRRAAELGTGLPHLNPLPVEKAAALGSAVILLIGLGCLVWVFPRQQLGDAHEWAARHELELGNPEEALPIFRKGQQVLPRDERFVIGEAVALAQTDQLEEALDRLQVAERMAPLSARVRKIHADLLRTQGDLEAALAKLDEAVALYPNDAGYRLERAELLLELGRNEAARADLDYIAAENLLLWEYQRPALEDLRGRMGAAAGSIP